MDKLNLLAGATPTVLIVDDDAPSRALLRVILEREGVIVLEGADGGAALARVSRQVPDLMLLDVEMPPPDGISVLRLLRERHTDAELPIILVTGHADTGSKVRGLEAGATDFVTKPYEPSELIARVRAALRTRAAFDQLESVHAVLAALANAVEAKDPSTEHHCSRLGEVALALARRAAVDGPELEAITYGAVLHDVGKIGVSEAVIRKRGPLDDAEWAEMRRHPVIGAGIVEPLRLGRMVAPIVRGHHERWDGSGYPDGLKGDRIPLGARIVALVDAYDAMTDNRSYRRAMSADVARDELVAGAGRHFDPFLTPLFLAFLGERDDTHHHAPPPAVTRISIFTRGLIEQPARR